MARNNSEKKCGTDQYAEAVGNMVKQYGKKAKAGELDITALDQLVEIQAILDEQKRDVVHGLRTIGVSWSEIGASLGMNKSTALRKFGEAPEGSPRKPGGQPSHLR